MIQEKAKNIVNFSGGKDSTAMLIRMLEENMQVDEIIFCKVMATPIIGGELPEMYEYIDKINNYIKLRYNKEIKVIEQEKSFEDYFYTEKIRGKNKGKIYGFPAIMKSWCNSRLKANILNQYLKKQGNYISYIGIAADEKKRLKRLSENECSMLEKWEMTEKDCFEFLKERNLENPLYKRRERLGCWFCPKQRIGTLEILKNEYPELWEKLLQWQRDSPYPFKPTMTVFDLDKRFTKEK